MLCSITCNWTLRTFVWFGCYKPITC
uniref:Uncharacterized protein n=1 Tax=Arundo donax TaxID=35708 RepID=A0A0A9CER8_ARUDO